MPGLRQSPPGLRLHSPAFHRAGCSGTPKGTGHWRNKRRITGPPRNAYQDILRAFTSPTDRTIRHAESAIGICRSGGIGPHGM
jgi:hypothetical protein